MTRPGRLAAIAAALVGLSVLLGIAVTHAGAPAFDARLVRDAVDLRDGTFGALMRALSRWGYAGRFALLVTAAVVVLLLGRRPGAAVQVVATVLLANVAFVALKHVFERPRPELADHVVGGWSMPSGHATMAFAFATVLWLVFEHLRSWWGVLLVGGYAVLTAMSRVVLGVHYPTDVLAGAMLGAACAFAVGAVATWSAERRGGRADRPTIR